MPAKVSKTSGLSSFPNDFKYAPLEQVRTLFVAFFQGLFRASPSGMYHWDSDDQITEIYISDESPVDVEMLSKRPGISLTRGPISFYSLGLDDMMAYDPRTGQKQKSVLVPGTMTVNCLSRAQQEAENIAWACAESLWLHRELLMAAGFFEVGRQPHVGAPTPAGSLVAGDNAKELFAVAVACPFQFYRTSQITPLGKNILQNISLSMRARLLGVSEQYTRGDGHCGPISSGGVDPPFQVQGCPPPTFAPQASDINGATPNPGGTAPVLPIVPHPLNPAQMVVVRASRPNCPAVRPPSMGGRAIPITTSTVEESCTNEADEHVTATSTVKV